MRYSVDLGELETWLLPVHKKLQDTEKNAQAQKGTK